MILFVGCYPQIISGKLFLCRNPQYYIDESLRAVADGNLVHRTGAAAGSYDSPSSSQPEVLKQDNAEAPNENPYSFQSSTSSYNFDNGQQLSSQTQNLAPFSSVMVIYDCSWFRFELVNCYSFNPKFLVLYRNL